MNFLPLSFSHTRFVFSHVLCWEMGPGWWIAVMGFASLKLKFEINFARIIYLRHQQCSFNELYPKNNLYSPNWTLLCHFDDSEDSWNDTWHVKECDGVTDVSTFLHKRHFSAQGQSGYPGAGAQQCFKKLHPNCIRRFVITEKASTWAFSWLKTARPLWPLRRGPNFTLRDRGVNARLA